MTIDTYRDVPVLPIIECELTTNSHWVRGTSHYLKVYYRGKYYSIYRSWTEPMMENYLSVSEIVGDRHVDTKPYVCFWTARFILFKFRKQISLHHI